MDEMTAFDQQIAREVLREAGPSEPVAAAAIFSSLATATQSPKWRFQSMFSATKFVVAGVIVALFGGFLLSGVLTTQRGDDMAPPAASTASASPSAETTADATSAPDAVTRTDILPGVALVTEEVEPGVLRVASDGVRDLAWPAEREDLPVHGAANRSIAAGIGGSVWLFGPDNSFRLGTPGAVRWGLHPLPSMGQPLGDDFEIGLDGTVYRVSRLGDGQLSYLASDGWTGVGYPQMYGIEVGSDGTLWGVWPAWECAGMVARPWEDPPDTCASYVSQLSLTEMDDDAGYLAPPSPKDFAYDGVLGFWVTDDGEVWTWDRWEHQEDANRRRQSLTRFDGSGFERIDVPAGIDPTLVDMAPEGTLWVQVGSRSSSILARFDGAAWTTFREGDGVPDLGGFEQGGPGFLVASPDQSVWVTPKGDLDLTGTICDGILHFDGVTWTHYLRELCIFGVSADPRGRVWVQAADAHVEPGEGLSTGMQPDPVETYVITPEADGAGQ